MQTLQFDENLIQEAARINFQPGLYVMVKQAIAEALTQARTHMSFRHRDNSKAVEAYSAMSLKEFEGINARQAWSNWRTIPRNLSGRIGDKPLVALDLCCGTGQSTAVLAWYLPKGSKIHGLEYNPKFVELARNRKYRSASGKDAEVTFEAQSVLETFKYADGSPMASESVDIVNSCGAVGHHFNPDATALIASEASRVLRKGGLALIDSGKQGTNFYQVKEIFEARGFKLVYYSKSCWIDRFIHICFEKK